MNNQPQQAACALFGMTHMPIYKEILWECSIAGRVACAQCTQFQFRNVLLFTVFYFFPLLVNIECVCVCVHLTHTPVNRFEHMVFVSSTVQRIAWIAEHYGQMPWIELIAFAFELAALFTNFNAYAAYTVYNVPSARKFMRSALPELGSKEAAHTHTHKYTFSKQNTPSNGD